MTSPEVYQIHSLRPRFRSSNIRTWIGFKEFMALAEEAVLCWFREHGLGAQELFHRHGVGLSVVDSSVVLPSVLETDDEVAAEVQQLRPGHFRVTLNTVSGTLGRVLRGTVQVALVPEPDAPGEQPLPDQLAPLLRAADTTDTSSETCDVFGFDWKARYFHCHFSNRVQHSAHVAALEEVVDRYLESRGLAVPELLRTRGWIPVVSKARVTALADVPMDTNLHTTFRVTGILKDRAYDGVMECWAGSGRDRRIVARGDILHGYAVSTGPQAGGLAELDATTQALLIGGAR